MTTIDPAKLVPGAHMRVLTDAAYIEVDARVRYWEDATVNGHADVDGKVPLRYGDCWKPVIRLSDGQISNWPACILADIHYKVCDEGLYWLLDAEGKRIASWKGHYVPDSILCVGENGFGDYIAFSVGGDGVIVGWQTPTIDASQWLPYP